MTRGKVLAEAAAVIIVLQLLLMFFESVAKNFVVNTPFAARMTTMTVMIVLSGVVLLYAKLQKVPLSVFPEHFGKFYIIVTVAAAVFLICVPSNFSGDVKEIFLLLYGSIVTPIFEELVFRGYLWNMLNSVFDKEKYTYFCSVILFTVWHLGYVLPQLAAGNWFAVLSKLAAGMVYGAVLGFVRLKCKNCYITMLLHGVLNAVMV